MGLLLRFEQTGLTLGYPVYRVSSVRGGVVVGVLQWSNQWRAPQFTPAATVVLNQRCLGEVWAMCKEFKR